MKISIPTAPMDVPFDFERLREFARQCGNQRYSRSRKDGGPWLILEPCPLYGTCRFAAVWLGPAGFGVQSCRYEDVLNGVPGETGPHGALWTMADTNNHSGGPARNSQSAYFATSLAFDARVRDKRGVVVSNDYTEIAKLTSAITCSFCTADGPTHTLGSVASRLIGVPGRIMGGVEIPLQPLVPVRLRLTTNEAIPLPEDSTLCIITYLLGWPLMAPIC